PHPIADHDDVEVTSCHLPPPAYLLQLALRLPLPIPHAARQGSAKVGEMAKIPRRESAKRAKDAKSDVKQGSELKGAPGLPSPFRSFPGTGPAPSAPPPSCFHAKRLSRFRSLSRFLASLRSL